MAAGKRMQSCLEFDAMRMAEFAASAALRPAAVLRYCWLGLKKCSKWCRRLIAALKPEEPVQLLLGVTEKQEPPLWNAVSRKRGKTMG